MEYDFPHFEITDPLRLWLDALYTAYKQEEHFNPRHIRRKLWNDLSKDFDTNNIPDVLAGYSHITPIGIWHLDPQTEIFNQIDNIFFALRTLLVEKYDQDKIEIDDLSSLSKIESKEIIKILNMISWTSSLRGELRIEFRQDPQSKRTIHYIDVGSGSISEEILTYEGVEKFIKDKLLAPKAVESPTENLFDTKTQTTKYEPNTAFILMWMDEKARAELEDISIAIKEVFEDYGIIAQRADDIEHQGVITNVIIEKIKISVTIHSNLR